MKTKKQNRLYLWYSYSLAFLAFSILSSCVNLKAVSDYSNASQAGIQKFEELEFNFIEFCEQTCSATAIRELQLTREYDCECELYKKADSITHDIYRAINGYFVGLGKLSSKELPDYNFDPLVRSIETGNFVTVNIDNEDLQAYTNIADILLTIVTGGHRKKKITYYLEQANEPIQRLLTEFNFIIQDNLTELLELRRSQYFQNAKNDFNDATTNDLKQKVVMEYLLNSNNIDKMQVELASIGNSIETIKQGHQELYLNRNKLSKKDLIGTIQQYSSQVFDIISEINKLKN